MVATHLYLRRLAIRGALASAAEAPLDEFIPFRRSSLNEYGEFNLADYVQPGSDDESHGFYHDI